MPIIFCGDTALPFGIQSDYESILPLFNGSKAIVNLEGSIQPDEASLANFRYKDKYSVYSCPRVLGFLKDINTEIVSLCNNHILDYKTPISTTEKLLADEGIRSFGLANHDIIETELDGRKLFVVTFATSSCEHALNLFKPSKVIADVARLRTENPDALIAVFPHWNRERIYLPEPGDRILARKLIDAGANLIVGHHPHRVLPVEYYKGVPIVYSLGNFLMAQGDYAGKVLKFKGEEFRQEAVLKWDGNNAELIPLYFDPDTNRLTPGKAETQSSHYEAIPASISDRDYKRLVRENTSLVGRLFHVRNSESDFAEKWSSFKRKMFRQGRRMMIKCGLHHPN